MQQQQQQQTQQNVQNNEVHGWDINDHHEIYIIKSESLKKSYDGIVKRLQKERIRYMKQPLQQEEIPNEKKCSEFISQFAQVKSEFIKHYQTNEILLRHQRKIKKRFDHAQAQLRAESKQQQ